MPEDDGVKLRRGKRTIDTSTLGPVCLPKLDADEKLIEAMARAIFDCEDPATGDPLAHTIHGSDEHAYEDGTAADQLGHVMNACRSAARAALTAYRKAQEGL